MSNIDDIDKAFHATEGSSSKIPAPKWAQRLAIGFVIALLLIILIKPTAVMHITCETSTSLPPPSSSSQTPPPQAQLSCQPTMTFGKLRALKYALMTAPFLYPIIQKWY